MSNIYVWGTRMKERKKDFVDDFIKKRRENPFPTHGDKTETKRKDKNSMNDSIWLILWIGARKKTIQWRFYVRINRSSNPNWSEVRTILPPVKYQGERKKISRFNQILSIPFFPPPQSFLFVENLADVSRFSDTWNETWTMEIVIKEEVKVS